MAVSETVNNLLKKKADDLEAYSQRPCIHVHGLQKDDHVNNDNLRKTVVQNISCKPESQKTTSRGVLVNFTEQGSMIKQRKHSQ